MFPLKLHKLVPGWRATALGHVLAGLGKGADYIAHYVPLYAPFDGTILVFNEWSGGNWIRVTRSNGDQIEFAHLHRRLVKTGDKVKEGQQIGVTGNTGFITTSPHLHIQIFVNKKRIDPEMYNWEETIDIPALFQRIWGRKAAVGEILYFNKRLQNGSIVGIDKLKEVMAYWYGIVYPNGKLSKEGNERWQKEKAKYI